MLKWKYQKKDVDRSTGKPMDTVIMKKKSRFSKAKQIHAEEVDLVRNRVTCTPEGLQRQKKKSECEKPEVNDTDEAINNLAKQLVKQATVAAQLQIAREDEAAKQQIWKETTPNEDSTSMCDDEELGSFIGGMMDPLRKQVDDRQSDTRFPTDLLLANRGFRSKKGISYQLRKLLCLSTAKSSTEANGQTSEKISASQRTSNPNSEIAPQTKATVKKAFSVRRLIGRFFGCRRCLRPPTSSRSTAGAVPDHQPARLQTLAQKIN